MTQATRVFEPIDAAQAEHLREALQRSLPADAQWRPTPHAQFSVKADGVVATCYRSGKLVLQGQDLDAFVTRYLQDLLGDARAKVEPTLPIAGVTLGSDETGKGDYFGPLVVAAVCVRPEQEARLREAGVTDSKKLSDNRVRTLAGLLERELPHEFSQLMPEHYNLAYDRAGNVNRLLADMHARALSRLLDRSPDARHLIVDQFTDESVLAQALARARPGHPPLTQVAKGERHVAVAAASILARAKFLEGLQQCSEACGTELAKGAGEPADAAARRVVAVGGQPLLAKVAKLHFANTRKL